MREKKDSIASLQNDKGKDGRRRGRRTSGGKEEGRAEDYIHGIAVIAYAEAIISGRGCE